MRHYGMLLSDIRTGAGCGAISRMKVIDDMSVFKECESMVSGKRLEYNYSVFALVSRRNMKAMCCKHRGPNYRVLKARVKTVKNCALKYISIFNCPQFSRLLCVKV
jgi:hypothetical protein